MRAWKNFQVPAFNQRVYLIISVLSLLHWKDKFWRPILLSRELYLIYGHKRISYCHWEGWVSDEYLMSISQTSAAEVWGFSPLGYHWHLSEKILILWFTGHLLMTNSIYYGLICQHSKLSKILYCEDPLIELHLLQKRIFDWKISWIVLHLLVTRPKQIKYNYSTYPSTENPRIFVWGSAQTQHHIMCIAKAVINLPKQLE